MRVHRRESAFYLSDHRLKRGIVLCCVGGQDCLMNLLIAGEQVHDRDATG